jgi:polyisoprenoid-binding protein YceI
MPPARRPLIALLCLLPLAACGYLIPAHHQTLDPAALESGAYRLDTDHASLHFKVDHLGFSTLVGRFDQIEASLDFDPADPTASKLAVRIQTGSLSINPKVLQDDLRGGSWFDVANYAEASFESRKITVTGPDSGQVEGDLTLHGVTKPVTLDVTFNGGGNNLLTGAYTLGFSATGTIKRSEFGLGAYVPAIGDDVILEIHAEFKRV